MGENRRRSYGQNFVFRRYLRSLIGADLVTRDGQPEVAMQQAIDQGKADEVIAVDDVGQADQTTSLLSSQSTFRPAS